MDIPLYSKAGCSADFCVTTEESVKNCTACVFPFTYQGITYTECTYVGGYSKPWCGTKTDENGIYQSGNWGFCNTDKCPSKIPEIQDCASVDFCITTKGSTKECSKCIFPFTYEGITYTGCTLYGGYSQPWCATSTDEKGMYQSGNWGFCDMDKGYCTEEI